MTDTRAVQHAIDVCMMAGIDRRPFELADVLDALADVADIPDAYRHKLRSLAEALTDVVVLEEHDADPWSRMDLSDVVVRQGAEQRVDLVEVAEVWGSLGDILPSQVSYETWMTIENLLRAGSIVEENKPEPNPEPIVEDTRPRCSAPRLSEGWHYDEREFGVVIMRDDELGYVEPVDVNGKKFKAFVRKDKRSYYEPVRTAKGVIAKFSTRHKAMVEVSRICRWGK